jgi:hypothetical protein
VTTALIIYGAIGVLTALFTLTYVVLSLLARKRTDLLLAETDPESFNVITKLRDQREIYARGVRAWGLMTALSPLWPYILATLIYYWRAQRRSTQCTCGGDHQ